MDLVEYILGLKFYADSKNRTYFYVGPKENAQNAIYHVQRNHFGCIFKSYSASGQDRDRDFVKKKPKSSQNFQQNDRGRFFTFPKPGRGPFATNYMFTYVEEVSAFIFVSESGFSNLESDRFWARFQSKTGFQKYLKVVLIVFGQNAGHKYS